MNELETASTTDHCRPLRFSDVPFDDLTRFLFDLGLELLQRAAQHQELSLGLAIQQVPGGPDFLRRLDDLPLGTHLPRSLLRRAADGVWAGLRNLEVLNELWLKRDRSEAMSARRQNRARRIANQIVIGKREGSNFTALFNELLERQVTQGSGCSIPVTIWQLAEEAAWTDLSFQCRATDIIHGVLRERTLRSGGWGAAPRLHPHTFRVLIWLSSPRGVWPRRLLHVLRHHAACCLSTPDWARFWDQWVIAEALAKVQRRAPRELLALPYVRERQGAEGLSHFEEEVPHCLMLSTADWNCDRPAFLENVWPPSECLTPQRLWQS
ncbi:MAG: hypothetical protein ACKV2Q_05770 [Planctomycetaceae bacterium]